MVQISTPWGDPLTGEWAPREALFVKLLWPLVSPSNNSKMTAEDWAILIWWCSTACTVKCLRTSWNCANQSHESHHGNISDPPPDSFYSYRATSSAPIMADGLSVWLVLRSGIPCRTACRIRLLAGTVSDNLWRRFCSQRTDAFSALEVSRRCAI